jgi:hypothetical protein
MANDGNSKMRYQNASTEPLEIIRHNECDAAGGLATSRFQALWNEIERLRQENLDLSRKVAELAAIAMGEEEGREYLASVNPPLDGGGNVG